MLYFKNTSLRFHGTAALISTIGLLASIANAQDLSNTASSSGSLTRATLANGIHILIKREPSTPLIALDAFIKVGKANENADNAGISTFVARTLLASTTNATHEEVASDIGSLGGNVTVSSLPDYTVVSALTVPDQFDNAEYIVTNALKNADFDAKDVDASRDDLLTDIDSATSSLFESGIQTVQSILYGNTGLALPDIGTRDTVEHLRRSDLIRFFHRFYIPQNITIVVTGNVDPQRAIAELSSSLEDMPAGRKNDVDFTDPVTIQNRNFEPATNQVVDLKQVSVLVAFQAPPVSNKDYAAMIVANAIVGGMKSSRMFREIREKQGLSYELGSVYEATDSTGILAAYAMASPTHTDRVTLKDEPSAPILQSLMLAIFSSMSTTPPSLSEIHRAQHFIIGSYNIKHERIEDRAALLGSAELESNYGADWDQHFASYITAVTPEDIARITARYFVHPIIVTQVPDTPGRTVHIE